MNQLFEKLDKIINEENKTTNEKCNHINTIIENDDVKMCTECGEELEKSLNYNFDFQNRVQKKVRKNKYRQ